MNEESKIYIRVKELEWTSIKLDKWQGLIETHLANHKIKKYQNNSTDECASLTFTNLPNN